MLVSIVSSERELMTSLRDSHPIAVLAGVFMLGSLAACSATPAGTGTGPGNGSTQSSTSGPYQDGRYEATGSYQSPNGTETIDVSLTLEGNIITDVEVTTHPTSPNTERFQGEFAAGIAGVIVGKNIDEISVSKVAGSSLTSGGFNRAIDEIKAEAVE
jgi:uncharacterized protein with FMN-binding domain